MLKKVGLILTVTAGLLLANTTVTPMDPADPSNTFRVVYSDYFKISVDANRILLRPVNDDESSFIYNGVPLIAEIKADHPQFNQLLAQAIAAGNTGRISFVVTQMTTCTDICFQLFAIDLVQN